MREGTVIILISTLVLYAFLPLCVSNRLDKFMVSKMYSNVVKNNHESNEKNNK